MLVGQAREAAELFTGHAIPESRTAGIYGELRRQALNLILVGMPGSGKTRIGRALARRMDRPFVDLDEEIVRRAGKSIPEIFTQEGEAAFRALERGAVCDICKGKGAVIATGGGAVLRADNVRAMRQNGRLCLLTRDLEALPTEGRPLSKSPEALREMWRVRQPFYRGAADITIENDAAPDTVAARAEEAYYEAVDR